MLLDEIDCLAGKIDHSPPDRGPAGGDPRCLGHRRRRRHRPRAGAGPGSRVLPAVARLDQIAGCGIYAAQAVIAETGLDMTVFGTADRLVSWAKRCPQTRQSGARTTHGKQGKGNPYLNGILGEIAASAARTDTFLGERYRRIARRRGKRKALAAIARSILVIIYHLLADPEARYHDLGPDHYDTRVNRDRKMRSLIHQLQAIDADPGEVAALLTRQPPAA